MADITTEQKLQLVQQIRSQYHKNQYDMSNRERILYGRSTKLNYEPSDKTYSHQEQASFTENTDCKTVSEFFRLRCILAVILFVFTILFDRLDINPAGIEMQQVFDAIAVDYKEILSSNEK